MHAATKMMTGSGKCSAWKADIIPFDYRRTVRPPGIEPGTSAAFRAWVTTAPLNAPARPSHRLQTHPLPTYLSHRPSPTRRAPLPTIHFQIRSLFYHARPDLNSSHQNTESISPKTTLARPTPPGPTTLQRTFRGLSRKIQPTLIYCFFKFPRTRSPHLSLCPTAPISRCTETSYPCTLQQSLPLTER